MPRLVGLVVLILAASVFPFAKPVSAGPGSCRTSDAGCTSSSYTIGGYYSEYRFGSSDRDLTNNYYQSENCPFGGCPAGNQVYNNVQRYRLNNSYYARFCRYGGFSYTSLKDWTTGYNTWATPSDWYTASLKLATGSC